MGEYDLTTLGRVKLEAEITSSKYDDFLNFLISVCSEAIEGYCQRRFILREYTEYYDGKNTELLLFRNYPVTEVTHIYVDNSRVFDSSSEITGFFLDKERNEILWSRHFPEGRANIKVVYKAGYEKASLPKDLEQACIRWVLYEYRVAIGARQGIRSVSLADKSTSYEIGEMPEEVKGLLLRYVRWLH